MPYPKTYSSKERRERMIGKVKGKKKKKASSPNKYTSALASKGMY